MEIFQIVLIQPLTNGLIVFYNLLGQNMGFAIIGFSTVLRLLLNPLTTPYMASMKKIKEVEPLLNKLKIKYKNDQKALVTAQTELYKQKGINPTAGCFPIIIQMVIFIALYNVFNHVLSQDGIQSSNLNNVLYNQLKFTENVVLNTKFLIWDMAKPDTFAINGISLPGILVILAAIAQFLSAKITQPLHDKEKEIAKKTPSTADDMAVAMQSTIYMIPLITLYFGLTLPSGLALYWLLFSIFQTHQQYKSSGWGGLTPFIKRIGLLK